MTTGTASATITEPADAAGDADTAGDAEEVSGVDADKKRMFYAERTGAESGD